MNQSMRGISLLLHATVLLRMPTIRALLYPASSVLQLTASISVPVIDLPPQRRVSYDWGFQMNYDMPFNISSFYNVPIWPTRRNITKRTIYVEHERHHNYDLSLLELYERLEEMFLRYGYHKVCLQRCICELAQYSLREDYLQLIGDILNLLSRPSVLLHPSFQQYPDLKVYMSAELNGNLNKSCSIIYWKCNLSPLDVFSTIVIS